MFKKNKSKELKRKNNFNKIYAEETKNFQLKYINSWGDSWNIHSLSTIHRESISRLLYYNELYKKIVGVPGFILEFGVQWGATLAQLISLRGIYEPYNHRRHIYGFDTFEGLVNTNKLKDGEYLSDGDYTVYKNFEVELEDLLTLHEKNCPISQIKKFTLIKGDVSKTVKQFIKKTPHTIIAMAIFDMDIYKPTKDALLAIKSKLIKGSVLVFDELNCHEFPGETEAVNEILGLNNLKLCHDPNQPSRAWTIWGE
jgi:hypothetical protein